MMVLRFLSFSTVSRFLHKILFEKPNYHKIESKATNDSPVQYDFGNIQLIFTFSSGSETFKSPFPFFGHKNDDEEVICSIEPRWYMQSV